MKVLFAVISCILITTSTVTTKERCQLDTNTKALLDNLFPMLLRLGVNVLKTKETIEKRWSHDSYHTANIQLALTPMQRLEVMNKTTTLSILEVNYRILKVFISFIRKFQRKFGAFSIAKDVAHQLQEIKWKVGNIMNYVQTIQHALKKPGQPRTAVIRPSASTASNSTSISVRGVSQTSAPVTPSVTALTLNGVALQASALLDDFYSNIVVMQLDFVKVAKALCPKE